MTYTGRKFSLSDPDPADVDIIDIAVGLSRICRWAGQGAYFLSVAEHSVAMSRMVTRKSALQALMHDAAEAYIGDISRPMKKLCPIIREVHDRIFHAICDRYNIQPVLYSDVLQADEIACATEAYHLFGKHTAEPEWNDDGQWLVGEPPDRDVKFFPPLDHQQSKHLFLNRWYEIGTPNG